jgi:two-component sensor histidine kinase
VLGYYPVTVPPFGLYVSAGISEAEAFQTIDAARRRDRVIMALVGLLLVALVWAAGQRFIQRPVERLLACIAAWRRGDYAVRSGMIAESGELAAVGAAFDSLIGDLVLRQAASERAEAQRQLLVGELTHRVKNTLALVQAIAVQSLRGADMAAAREVFQSRLRALAEAHDVLTAHSWEAASLRDVLDRTLLPYRDGWPGRFALSGPALRLQPRAALAVALSVHELATNAVKYGALSVEGGQVRIVWRIDGDGTAARFRFVWTEAGGPPVTPPSRAGFGSRMIRTALGAELGGSAEMAFAPDGLVCSLDAPLATVAADLAAQADEVAAED